MEYSAEEIRKNWERIDRYNTPLGGRYSTWRKEPHIAGLCEDTDEVLVVLNFKTHEVVYWGIKKIPKMVRDTFIVGIIQIPVGSKKHPMQDTITEEIKQYAPPNWKLVETYNTAVIYNGKQEKSIVLLYYGKLPDDKKEKDKPETMAVLFFSCLKDKNYIGLQYGYTNETKFRYEKFFHANDISILIEKALKVMNENKITL